MGAFGSDRMGKLDEFSHANFIFGGHVEPILASFCETRHTYVLIQNRFYFSPGTLAGCSLLHNVLNNL